MKFAAIGAVLAVFAPGMSSGTTLLNPDNFDDEVFNSGKNVFVKFFAPWCGHCKRMKPDWDKLADEFADSSSVLVADVDCTAEQGLCSKYGISGFPTLKYWKDGSKEPQDYKSGRSFDVLKKFVQDNLEIACQVSDLSTCTDKEKSYHSKWQAKDKTEIEKELTRLKGMSASSMKPDLKQWLVQRINILTQLNK